MHSDGKQLEALVSFVEKTLVPPGFEVKANSRIFNDEGVQIAEFDIEICGKIGSTSIAWLIECRDRPGQGAAPGSWIEQLVGRRDRFGFNKVTAVSTTGFAAGAVEYASRSGIELREVKNLHPSCFSWLKLSEMTLVSKIHDLKHANIGISSNVSKAAHAAAVRLLEQMSGNDEVLVCAITKARVTVAQAFIGAMQTQTNIFNEVAVDRSKQIHAFCQYPTDDHYSIETESGSVRVDWIEFFGELRIEELKVPIISASEYRHVETGEIISQLATFSPNTILGMNLSLELHRVGENGETHILMRRLPDV